MNIYIYIYIFFFLKKERPYGNMSMQFSRLYLLLHLLSASVRRLSASRLKHGVRLLCAKLTSDKRSLFPA